MKMQQPTPLTPKERQQRIEETIRRLRVKSGFSPDGRALDLPTAQVDTGQAYHLDFRVTTKTGLKHEVTDPALRSWAKTAAVIEGVAAGHLPPGEKLVLAPEFCRGLLLSGQSASACLKALHAKRMMRGLAEMVGYLLEGRDFMIIEKEPPKEAGR